MKLDGTSFLLLEDEPLLRRRIAARLEKLGAEVTALDTVADARRALTDLSFDFALMDVNLPDGKSLTLLEEKCVPASTVAVVMTAEGGVDGAVEAIRLGAADYLVKPFDLDELPLRLLRASKERRTKRGEEHSREQQAPDDGFIFGGALKSLETQLEKILSADRRLRGAIPPPVLIEGETGTGKTTLARWIHYRGPRSQGPLVEVNCSALPDTLAESELFGHERGAFTDAREARMGLLEAAEGGTVFLDELPSLSPAIQAKLLKAVEDRVIRRVGGNRTIPIDARIVAATNVDLGAAVAAGRFREDLLHRLDLFRLKIPPLRERGDDILKLATALVARVAKTYGLPAREIPPEGRRRLLAHRWPGNVRELAHEVERSMVFDDDQLTFASLARYEAGAGTDGAGAGLAEGFIDSHFRFPEQGFSLDAAIDRLIRMALQQADGNVSAAARLLGVSRDTVRYRLKASERESGGRTDA